jgi:hypothetical protein
MTPARLSEVHRWLQAALELELFTIPPYLTALYSMHPGSNQESAAVIQGVVMEEMLHVILVANVLNAVGGKPCLSPELTRDEASSPCILEPRRYPGHVPHVKLKLKSGRVGLRRFSRRAVETFREIEEPDEWSGSSGPPFTSIGELYDFILARLIALCVEHGEKRVFTGDRSRQVDRDRYYYGAGGGVVPVYGLSDAKDAIAQVAEQGEGRRKVTNVTGDLERFGQPKEVAHYYRFNQVLTGRYYDRDNDLDASPDGPRFPVDWDAVYPMQDNPAGDGRGPDGVSSLLKEFDDCYRRLLEHLHRGFNGQQERLGHAVGEMHRLRHRATALMRVPIGQDGTTYGPPFWYVVSRPIRRGRGTHQSALTRPSLPSPAP